jgi:hypothetical protein
LTNYTIATDTYFAATDNGDNSGDSYLNRSTPVTVLGADIDNITINTGVTLFLCRNDGAFDIELGYDTNPSKSITHRGLIKTITAATEVDDTSVTNRVYIGGSSGQKCGNMLFYGIMDVSYVTFGEDSGGNTTFGLALMIYTGHGFYDNCKTKTGASYDIILRGTNYWRDCTFATTAVNNVDMVGGDQWFEGCTFEGATNGIRYGNAGGGSVHDVGGGNNFGNGGATVTNPVVYTHSKAYIKITDGTDPLDAAHVGKYQDSGNTYRDIWFNATESDSSTPFINEMSFGQVGLNKFDYFIGLYKIEIIDKPGGTSVWNDTITQIKFFAWKTGYSGNTYNWDPSSNLGSSGSEQAIALAVTTATAISGQVLDDYAITTKEYTTPTATVTTADYVIGYIVNDASEIKIFDLVNTTGNTWTITGGILGEDIGVVTAGTFKFLALRDGIVADVKDAPSTLTITTPTFTVAQPLYRLGEIFKDDSTYGWTTNFNDVRVQRAGGPQYAPEVNNVGIRLRWGPEEDDDPQLSESFSQMVKIDVLCHKTNTVTVGGTTFSVQHGREPEVTLDLIDAMETYVRKKLMDNKFYAQDADGLSWTIQNIHAGRDDINGWGGDPNIVGITLTININFDVDEWAL